MEVEPLRTILLLECRRGYSNTSVIGGLDKYLLNWSGQNRGEISSPTLLARFDSLFAKPDYATWDRKRREVWVHEVLDWLDEVEKLPVGEQVEISKQEPVVSKQRSRRPKSAVYPNSLELDSTVTSIKGVSSILSSRLARLGIKTIRDLLYFFPRRHLDYSQRRAISELEIDKEQTVLATVWESHVTKLGTLRSTEVILGDGTGNIRAVWFNQPFLAKRFRTNATVVISGKVTEFKGQKVFESPEWELLEDKELIHTGRLVPVYPLTRGLYPRQMRSLVRRAIDEWAWLVSDFLPQDIKQRCRLLDLSEAVVQAHYPDSYEMKAEARRRLAFDELFFLQLGVLSKKREWQEGQPGNAFHIEREEVVKFINSLPFSLTRAQQRAIQDILHDLQKSRAMSRLLQGEVGSGKTVVATVALLMAAANDYQGVLMAPTEILAEQHFRNLCLLFSRVSSKVSEDGNVAYYHGLISRQIGVALLTGSLNEKQRSALYRAIKAGKVDIVIGTHALIQKGVEFGKLGLVVIDEQHRFGVLQRAALRQKGFNPHVLVMTATPIPRTLALTLYGDLDLTVIDELPPGRQKVQTRWLSPEQRGRAYEFIHRRVLAGEQAFIICPLIEGSDNIEAKAALDEYERLSREVFPDLRLGVLHGRMTAMDKDKVMQLFRDGKLDILISTPVVEVGIDVPNATVMLVEAADRFGLSQLHQFRGRVGRGSKQSFCLLLAENPSLGGIERLKAIEQIYDGFTLAEKDLELRGPGEFFGTRQSGLPDLRMAKLSDVALLELARNEASMLFEKDPCLKMPEHRALALELARVWQVKGELS
jgi:ATP-dependent DNA helicase RecG